MSEIQPNPAAEGEGLTRKAGRGIFWNFLTYGLGKGGVLITTSILDVLQAKPEKFDPRDYLKPARKAVYEMVKGKILAFGSAGRARDYKPVSLQRMKKNYEQKAQQ